MGGGPAVWRRVATRWPDMGTRGRSFLSCRPYVPTGPPHGTKALSGGVGEGVAVGCRGEWGWVGERAGTLINIGFGGGLRKVGGTGQGQNGG